MHLYSDDMAVLCQTQYTGIGVPATRTSLVRGFKQIWRVDFHMTEHFLPHNAVNPIRANDNVSSVRRSIFALNGHGFVIVINPRDSLVRDQTSFVFKIVVQSG